MIEYEFVPRGVCSRNIHVELSDDGNTIENIQFTGGCNGNLNAISKLVRGMSTQECIDLLKGNTCGPRPTSCADQMTIALDQARSLAQA